MYGCAAPELKYDSSYSGVIDFSKQMIVDLSAGADKLLSRQHDRETDKGAYTEYRGKFFPRSGVQGVLTSYENYCKGIGGVYKLSQCVKENDPDALLFYAEVTYSFEITSIECTNGVTTFGKDNCGKNINLQTIKPVVENKDLRVWLKVYEPKSNTNHATFKNKILALMQ
jgi:hypothetical protein